MKILIIILMLAPTISIAGGIEPDKAAHFAGSYAVAITVELLMERTTHPVLYSFAVGMVPGLVKRAYDQTQSYSPREKNQDMIANVLGAASGSIIGHGIQMYIEPNNISATYNIKF